MSATTEYLERQAEALLELIEKKDAYITRLQDEVSTLTEKLGSNHTNCDYWKSENGRVQSQIIALINAAYAEETDANEILVDLAQIIDYSPVKEVQFTATMSFTGTIEVPMDEADSFDLEEVLSDAYVDINNGNVVIDNYELYDANEC